MEIINNIPAMVYLGHSTVSHIRIDNWSHISSNVLTNINDNDTLYNHVLRNSYYKVLETGVRHNILNNLRDKVYGYNGYRQ